MRPLTRVLSSALAATVATVVVAAVPASASTPTGLGGTTTTSSVLSLKIGSLLDLGLLTDNGGESIDSLAGTPKASGSLVPITLDSPLLNLNLSTPAISTLQPGGSASANGQALTLSSLGIPSVLASGSIKPAALTSLFANTSAADSIQAAEVDNLDLVGGALANISLLSTGLTSSAKSTAAAGDPTTNLSSINVLDLGALISGLGGTLADLPVGTLSSLAATLGVPVPDVAGGGSLADEVASLSDAITSLRNTLATTVTDLTTPIDATTTSLLGTLGLGADVPAVGTPDASLVTTVNNLIGSLQTTLVNLLTGVLGNLDVAPLLSVSGVTLGVNTLAANLLSGSSAGVTYSPLNISVAGVKLPALDITNAASTLNEVLSTATGALNSLVAELGLPANLLSLSILGNMHDVTQSGAYNVATAGLSLLSLKIAPLTSSVVSDALGGLTGTTASSLLGGTSLTGLLGASSDMGGLSGLLGVAAPLLSGVDLEIGALASQSAQRVNAPESIVNPPSLVTPPSPQAIVPVQLPHTGGDPELAIIGMILAGLGIVTIRWARISRSHKAAASS